MSTHFALQRTRDHGPRIGILGGGQLARMLALAAYPLGFSIAILQRKPGHNGMAWNLSLGDWDDPETLVDFARGVDFVTLENEFVDADALAALEADGHPLWPSSECIRRVQDKLVQKQTLAAAGLPLPDFRDAPTPESVVEAAREWGWPLVLKKRRNGYDGKGNATLRHAGDVDQAWQRLGGDHGALYVERFCAFTRELAVMVTRGRDGATMVYPVVETLQRDHICHVVQAPAQIPEAVASAATDIARRAVEAIDGVGSVGVELFETADGALYINEMAPRVHNSGHYTIEACVCSQFENHVRAVAGVPLGSPALIRPAAVMINLLGASDGPGHPTGLEAALEIPGAHVHLYGKDRSVKGRKMGHVTALGDSIDEAMALARRAADALRFGA